MKNFIYGIVIGITNIIPGISGGTIMVLLGIFEKFLDCLTNIKKKENLVFLIQVLLGAVTGIVLFSKILEFLFANFYIPTMYWFIGMMVVSFLCFLKDEIKFKNISWGYFILGVIIITILFIFSPEKSEIVYTVFPNISYINLILLLILGVVVGITALTPGISGTMILLIVNQYYLFKSYLANVFSFKLNILLPLGFLGLGLLLGFYFGAKILRHFLNKSKDKTYSFILGLLAMSIILLIPINVTYDLKSSLLSVVTFIFGFVIIYFLNKLKTN